MAFPFGNRAQWCQGTAVALGARHPGKAPRSSQGLSAFLQQESVISKFSAVQAEPMPMLISLARAWEVRSFWDKEGKCLSMALVGLCSSRRRRYGCVLHPSTQQTGRSQPALLTSQIPAPAGSHGEGGRDRGPVATLLCQRPPCCAGAWMGLQLHGEGVSGAGFWGGERCGEVPLTDGRRLRWGVAQMAVPPGQGCPGGCTQPCIPPTPDLLVLLATLGTRGIKMPPNQGLGRFCSALRQGSASPDIRGGNLWCSTKGQDGSQPLSHAQHCGDVTVLKGVAVPAPDTGTVCVHHAEGAESGPHRAPKPPYGNAGREWGYD